MAKNFYRDYGKRLFDLALVIPAMIFLAPILAITAIMVRIYLGSPVLFRQERPGRGGRIFEVCKFRTMTNERDADGKLLIEAIRLTPFGRFLRSTSLDELPELYNIVAGQMSLVGPRPLRTYYLSRYSPEQARRHDVTPGITGWAQVNGRNSLSWEARFELDVWYVDNMSFFLDVAILWKTIAAVLSRKGVFAEGEVVMPDFEGTPEIIDIRTTSTGLKVTADSSANPSTTTYEDVRKAA